MNPNKYGVLPVLVILENGTGKALRLDLQAEFVTADSKHVTALPADDVQHLRGVTEAAQDPGAPPLPIPFPTQGEGRAAECPGDRRARVFAKCAGGRARFLDFSISRPNMSRGRSCT